jgi:hypothetical protein
MAVSSTVDPRGTLVTVMPLSWTFVTVVVGPGRTVKGSHPPVEGLYVPSPLYVAWNEYLPLSVEPETVSGPSLLEVATPLPLRAPVPAEVPVPEQVPLVKKVKVTFPVGVPAEPDTVAWSVTDVPSGIEVTGAPFCITEVTVLLGLSWIAECEPVCWLWSPTGQFEAPLEQVSCHVSVTSSVRM